MTVCGYLLETGLSNAVVAGLLMLMAWWACRCCRSPAVGSLAWTTVLLKLLTPPCILLPLAILSSENKLKLELQPAHSTGPQNTVDRGDDLSSTTRARFAIRSGSEESSLTESNQPASDNQESRRQDSIGDHPAADVSDDMTIARREAPTRVFRTPWSWSILIAMVCVVWFGGTLAFAGLAISRLIRFRSLVQLCDAAPEQILKEIRQVAAIAGLRSIPHVKVVDGRLSPSVGCWGLKPTLVLPREFYATLNATERQSLIAHELAHVRRGDHWRAWLELAATVVFWWYPLAWLARRECRRSTERCCDDWVLRWFPENAADYAETLLKSVDFVSSTGQGMPGVIHGIGDFATMKRRIVLILNGGPSPSLSRPTKGGLWLMAIVALLIGAQFIESQSGDSSREVIAAERPVEQTAAVDVPSAEWKTGDIAFVVQAAQIRGDGDVVTTLRRGTMLQIQEPTDQVLVVKEPDWGTGEAAGSIDRKSVATASKAVEILSAQIQNDPNDAGAFTARGIVRWHESESDLAIKDFNEAIRLDPGDAIAFLYRARSRNKEESDKKLADLTEAIRLDPELKRAYRIRFGIYLLQQEFEKAGADCEQLSRLNPRDAQSLTMSWAISMAKKDLKSNSDKIAKLSLAIQRDPNNPQRHLKRAETYTSIGIDPGDEPHFTSRETDKERERNDRAIVDYTEAIRLDPKLERALMGRGDIRLYRHEYDLAIADFTAVIAIDPRNANAIYRRGLSWSEKEEFDKSIADFTEVIRLEPKYSYAFKHRAEAWERTGNDDRAIEDYTTAIRLIPTEVSFGIGIGERNEIKTSGGINPKRYVFLYGHRGARFEKRLDYAKATADYADSLRHDSKDHFTNRQLGWLLATCPEDRYRDGEQAVKHAVVACQQNHWRDARDLDTLAAAYAETGNFRKAIESQQRACKMTTEVDQSSYSSRLELYKTGKPYRSQPPRIADNDKTGGSK